MALLNPRNVFVVRTLRRCASSEMDKTYRQLQNLAANGMRRKSNFNPYSGEFTIGLITRTLTNFDVVAGRSEAHIPRLEYRRSRPLKPILNFHCHASDDDAFLPGPLI